MSQIIQEQDSLLDRLNRFLEDIKQTKIDRTGKDTLILIGNSGSGQSTTCQLLNNQTLKSFKKGYGYCLESQDQNDKDIGHNGESMTNSIKYYDFPNENHIIADTPGFNDNRGQEIDLINNFNIDYLYRNSIKTKTIICVEHSHLIETQLEGINKLFQLIIETFGDNFDQFLQSTILLVTSAQAKYVRETDETGFYKQKFQKYLMDNVVLDEQMKKMCTRFQESNIAYIKACEKNGIDITLSDPQVSNLLAELRQVEFQSGIKIQSPPISTQVLEYLKGVETTLESTIKSGILQYLNLRTYELEKQQTFEFQITMIVKEMQFFKRLENFMSSVIKFEEAGFDSKILKKFGQTIESNLEQLKFVMYLLKSELQIQNLSIQPDNYIKSLKDYIVKFKEELETRIEKVKYSKVPKTINLGYQVGSLDIQSELQSEFQDKKNLQKIISIIKSHIEHENKDNLESNINNSLQCSHEFVGIINYNLKLGVRMNNVIKHTQIENFRIDLISKLRGIEIDLESEYNQIQDNFEFQEKNKNPNVK